MSAISDRLEALDHEMAEMKVNHKFLYDAVLWIRYRHDYDDNVKDFELNRENMTMRITYTNDFVETLTYFDGIFMTDEEFAMYQNRPA